MGKQDINRQCWKRSPYSLSDNQKAAPQTAIHSPKWAGLLALVVAFAGWAVLAQAQQAEKVYRIGYLSNSARISRSGVEYRQGRAQEAFLQALQDLGYVEGYNLVIEWRFSERKRDRLPALADELIRLKVDVLFTASLIAALAAKKTTRTNPIVFLSAVDPVAAGLVDSLAQPGGNISGLTHIAPALAGKSLELLKETIPKLSRVAVLWHSGNPGSEQIWEESRLAAPGLGLQLYSMEVTTPDQFEIAFQEAIRANSAALAVTQSSLLNANRQWIADLAIKHRLPAIYSDSQFVRSGGLMSYATDRTDQYRRAAIYVDKILQGADPGSLPVERPTKFELIISLKAAKNIGLTIPPAVLYRATKVIK